MFKTIAKSIPAYPWAPDGSRYRELDVRDRLLDGTFYDHLMYSFYQEMDGNNPVSITDRRPSSQFRLPRMVARWSARKLFSGRHVPRVKHSDPKQREKIEALIVMTGLYRTMMEIVLRGSVGSVAATFRIETTPQDNTTENVNASVRVWKAKYCWPTFDTMGELAALRVCYITSPTALKALNIPKMDVLEPNRQYWFVRDFLTDKEITYQPVLDCDWDPVRGWSDSAPKKSFEPWEQIDHKLGFVPGHWFKNLTGGTDPDGVATWEDAIPDTIELDYLQSQISRGTRYNCAPQPVIKGKLLNSPNDFARGPATAIFLDGDRKGEDGMTLTGGDAFLLEMDGKGTEAGLKVVDKLHDHALEQISAARKDPQRMKGPLSGRGMEFLDEDSHDLVMELRTSYGDEGMLPLLRKLVVAALDDVDATAMSLIWPRLYQPTAADLQAIGTALSLFVNPLKAPYSPATAASSDTNAQGQTSTTPATPEVLPPEEFQLLDTDQARLVVQSYLDLEMLELEGDAVAKLEGQQGAAAPGEGQQGAPPALGPEHAPAEPAPEATGSPVADAMQNVLNHAS